MTDRTEKTSQLMDRLHSIRRLLMLESQTETITGSLSQSQWLALHLVSRHEGMGIKELASLLGISPSATTQLVDSLVNKNLLDRQPSPGDRRALCLTLPEESHRQIEVIREKKLARLEYLFSPLSDPEFDVLLELLDKIINKTPTGKR